MEARIEYYTMLRVPADKKKNAIKRVIQKVKRSKSAKSTAPKTIHQQIDTNRRWLIPIWFYENTGQYIKWISKAISGNNFSLLLTKEGQLHNFTDFVNYRCCDYPIERFNEE